MTAQDSLSCAVVVVAAGSGRRLGAAVPKAFLQVAGRTLLEHAVEPFRLHPQVGSTLVVAPPGYLAQARALTPARVVTGGATRQESVAAGLAALPPDVELVLVHDVARPFVPAEVITAVVDALLDGADAVVPVIPVHDTVRRVVDGGAFGGIVERSELVAVQTPQGFRRSVLVEAHEAGRGLRVADDAALVEAVGGAVVAVPGSDVAFTITRPWDLAIAEAVAARG